MMRSSRVILLLAASMLVAAELVSMSLLLRGIGENQARRTSAALDRALLLMPQIAEWTRAQARSEGATISAPWIEPFDRLSVLGPTSLDLGEADRRRLEGGELVVVSRVSDRVVKVLGRVQTDHGPTTFALTERSTDDSRLATDRVLIAQHALILLCALAGLVLAALGRAPLDTEEGSAPALHAYEEAMSRLRLRDDERVAAFEREKSALAEVLRDREAMARAGELTAGIVHEMGNSLAAIVMQAEFAAKSSDERSRAAGAAVIEEARFARGAMASFVDFIRTNAVQHLEFELGKLVGRVVARESAHRPAQVAIEGAPTMVSGDEDLLERAIENVVRNACQAVGESGRVGVKFGSDATHAFVIVDDNGPGIKNPERALRPFESSRPGGLGLGLPLALKILNLHQGTLHIGENVRGGGCQVVCKWPKSA
jgi:signal transduction histidine kinase